MQDQRKFIEITLSNGDKVSIVPFFVRRETRAIEYYATKMIRDLKAGESPKLEMSKLSPEEYGLIIEARFAHAIKKVICADGVEIACNEVANVFEYIGLLGDVEYGQLTQEVEKILNYNKEKKSSVTEPLDGSLLASISTT